MTAVDMVDHKLPTLLQRLPKLKSSHWC